MSRLPVLGITMGDPAGVGPEIAVKAIRVSGAAARVHAVNDPAEAVFRMIGRLSGRDPGRPIA
jgi:4-hydroxy-L-threonine phosphate dehydrogenase PdxA